MTHSDESVGILLETTDWQKLAYFLRVHPKVGGEKADWFLFAGYLIHGIEDGILTSCQRIFPGDSRVLMEDGAVVLSIDNDQDIVIRISIDAEEGKFQARVKLGSDAAETCYGEQMRATAEGRSVPTW